MVEVRGEVPGSAVERAPARRAVTSSCRHRPAFNRRRYRCGRRRSAAATKCGRRGAVLITTSTAYVLPERSDGLTQRQGRLASWPIDVKARNARRSAFIYSADELDPGFSCQDSERRGSAIACCHEGDPVSHVSVASCKGRVFYGDR